jgi:hypothetical protein
MVTKVSGIQPRERNTRTILAERAGRREELIEVWMVDVRGIHNEGYIRQGVSCGSNRYRRCTQRCTEGVHSMDAAVHMRLCSMFIC